MYQVKWFNRSKGYGFLTDGREDYFVHHSDMEVEGYRYLTMGEYVRGEVEEMSDGRKKVVKVKAGMEWGRLVCEMERKD